MKNNKKQRAKGKSAIPYLIGTVISAFTTVIFVIALVISATLINGTDVSLDELSFEPFTYSHCAEEHLNDGRKTIAIYSNEEKEPIYINPDQLEYVDIKTIEAIPPDTLFFIRGKEIEGIGRVAYGMEYANGSIFSAEDFIINSPLTMTCITVSTVLIFISFGVTVYYFTKYLNKKDKLSKKK